MLGDKIKYKICDGVYVCVGDSVVIDVNKVGKRDKFIGLDCLDLGNLSRIRFKRCLIQGNGLELYRLGARYKNAVTKSVILCVYKGVVWVFEEDTLREYLLSLNKVQLNRLLSALGGLAVRELTNILGWLGYTLHKLGDSIYMLL